MYPTRGTRFTPVTVMDDHDLTLQQYEQRVDAWGKHDTAAVLWMLDGVITRLQAGTIHPETAAVAAQDLLREGMGR